ncbi:MAG: NAD(P)-dependent oxidoreductase [Chloroflexota bacterium]|nr:NAD(P)-dependent oxidoreductase [Chloroflexota bacterium]
MRVIVTGGSGKAGREVVRVVAAAGHEVVNLDFARPAHGLDLPGEFCRVDLTDAGEVYDAFFQFRPGAVCHLAANPSPSGQSRLDVFSNNVSSTYNVLQAAGDLGVSRVAYASSEMATGLIHEGVVPTRIPFDESERHPSPNAYALSKYLGEVIAESIAVRYPATAFIGLRINNVIAPDEYHVLRARRDDPATGAFNFWSYIDARDVGGAYLAAITGTTTGNEVFLIAAADTSADRPLSELMAAHYPGYDRIDPGHDDFASAFSSAKIARLLDWTPQYSWRDQSTGGA